MELSAVIVEKRIVLDALSGLDDAAAVARLTTLRGVGRWTAEYVLLRGLRRLQVFPCDDVGARNNLGRLLKSTEKLTYEATRRIVERWQPFAGLVYFHLLVDRLASRDPTLMPIASPEPFELHDAQVGALTRRRRLPEGADSLSDRRLLEFCRGSLALLGQASLLDTLRQFDFVTMTVPPPPAPEKP